MSRARWPALAAAGLGFVWFVKLCGFDTLNPLNTVWMFTGDWRQHWLGFLFFQRAPWAFPLGSLPSLHYPIGTNVGFTDSNPLLSILVKPFAGVLPAEYQLIGPWLALCFVLQGYMGAKLASVVAKDSVMQMLGGGLFVVSPVLFARLGHDTLCAHWVLLALLYLGLREYPDRSRAQRAPWFVVGVVMVAAGVHPYLAAMTWVLALAVLIRLWRSKLLTATRTVLWMLAATAGLIGVWAVVGYLGNNAPDGSGGFGLYPADLLALFDPREYSHLMPPLPSIPGEWEGVGFLGVGGIAAMLAGLVALVRQRPSRRPGVGVVAVACLLLAIYALSSSIKYGGEEVANVQRLYDPLMPLVKPFRSSGRFIWPLHYLVLTFGLWGVTRVFGRDRTRPGIVFLSLAVVVQAADVKMDRWWLSRKPEPQVSTDAFALAHGQYRHLALAPPQVLMACGDDPYPEDYVYRFMLLAHRLNLTFNSGLYARVDITKSLAACEAQNRETDAGRFDADTIYVVPADDAPSVKTKSDAACGRWDGTWFCVSRSAHPRAATYIETGKDIGTSNGP